MGYLPGWQQYAVPEWLKPVVNDVFQLKWADSSTNNSNSVRFSYNTSGVGVVRFAQGGTIVECDVDEPGWLGCAVGDPISAWKVWLRSNALAVTGHRWCDLELETGCPDAGRVAIHEIGGHVAGWLYHYAGGWSNTRMSSLPFYNDNTWNTRTMGPCDEARLQMWFDVKNFAGGYSDGCWDTVDHITNGKLETLTTTTPNFTEVCSGATVTLTGRLKIRAWGSYGAINDNNLVSRSIDIMRNGSVHKSFATNGALDPSNNIVTTVTATVANTTTYTYYARFTSGEAALNSSSSSPFTILWIKPAEC